MQCAVRRGPLLLLLLVVMAALHAPAAQARDIRGENTSRSGISAAAAQALACAMK
jgi:hypothetical protein